MATFEDAVFFIQNFDPKKEKNSEVSGFAPSDSDKLAFYGLFKQATAGPAKGSAPSMFDVVGRMKYNAWKSHGDMSMEDAKSAYMNLLTERYPPWRHWEKLPSNLDSAQSNEPSSVNRSEFTSSSVTSSSSHPSHPVDSPPVSVDDLLNSINDDDSSVATDSQTNIPSTPSSSIRNNRSDLVSDTPATTFTRAGLTPHTGEHEGRGGNADIYGDFTSQGLLSVGSQTIRSVSRLGLALFSPGASREQQYSAAAAAGHAVGAMASELINLLPAPAANFITRVSRRLSASPSRVERPAENSVEWFVANHYGYESNYSGEVPSSSAGTGNVSVSTGVKRGQMFSPGALRSVRTPASVRGGRNPVVHELESVPESDERRRSVLSTEGDDAESYRLTPQSSSRPGRGSVAGRLSIPEAAEILEARLTPAELSRLCAELQATVAEQGVLLGSMRSNNGADDLNSTDEVFAKKNRNRKGMGGVVKYALNFISSTYKGPLGPRNFFITVFIVFFMTISFFARRKLRRNIKN